MYKPKHYYIRVDGVVYEYYNFPDGSWIFRVKGTDASVEAEDGRKWHAHFHHIGGCMKLARLLKGHREPAKAHFIESMRRVLPEERWDEYGCGQDDTGHAFSGNGRLLTDTE